MTEAEWLASTEPVRMLHHLHGKASDRKLRLFICAGLRNVFCRLNQAGRSFVELAERYADGCADEPEREAALQKARQWARPNWRQQSRHLTPTVRAAMRPVRDVLQPRMRGSIVADATYHLENAAAEAAYRDALLQNELESAYEQSNKARAAMRATQCELLRDLFGGQVLGVTADPAWTNWNERIVCRLARSIYDDRAFDRLPILADALEDAGCSAQSFLDHCRSGGLHTRGCWVVDALLSRQ